MRGRVDYERERLHRTPNRGGVQRAILGSGRDDLLGGDTMIVWAVRVAHKRVRQVRECSNCGGRGVRYRTDGTPVTCKDCRGTGQVED
jgi:hypothetical protein